MHRFTPLPLLSLLLIPLPAQEPAAPTVTAGSPESAALLDKACAKMLALGRGTFRTTEEQENPFRRQIGGDAPAGSEIEGGWHGGTVWGSVGEDGDLLFRQRGRTVVKSGDSWRLRRDKLPSGAPMPFVLDPDLLFTVLRELPDEALKVRNVEATRLLERDVLILALGFDGEAALEIAQSGALPPVQAAMNQVLFVGGAGGRVRMPQPEVTVDIGLFVDAKSGDVLRIRAKVYEKGGMFGGGRVVVAGAPGVRLEVGGAGERKAEDEEDAKPAADGKPVYKKGLLERKLGEQESMVYLRADFAELGMASPPELDDRAKRLLGR